MWTNTERHSQTHVFIWNHLSFLSRGNNLYDTHSHFQKRKIRLTTTVWDLHRTTGHPAWSVWGEGGGSTAQGQRDIVVGWAMTQCTIWSLHGGNMLCLCSYAPLKCIFYLDFNLLLPNLDIDLSYKNKSPVRFLNSQQEGDYDHLPNCLKTPLKTLNIV